ncbi:MAG TPA: carbohydrate-binding protein [Pseudonocardiaceae bacterium]|jgi:chitinase|nr:carbohydrate-binding protein [Pseudonocardiaceae bacterium]
MQRLSMTAALGAAVVAAGSLIAFAGISNATQNSAQHNTTARAAAVSSGWYGAAPYVMPLDNNPPNLPQVMAATGQQTFELAFVLSDGGCSAAWGGTQEVSSDTAVANIISGVRAAGGDVSVSFGGYGGTKLGQVCGSAQATAAAEQAVINKYQLKAVDFDLEEPEYENTTAIDNEIGAAQILQQNNAGLYVSITTAGTTAGTGYFGQNVLNTAKSDNFVPANYSIMPFDGGFNGAASQTAALESFHTLLMNTFGWNSATAYNHEGVSQMNGRTDSAEYFYQADFQSVLSYAQSHGLTRYTFWSVNRDLQCNPPNNNGQLSGTCSSVPQNSWDFTKYTAEFGGAVPPTSPPPPPPTTNPPGQCTVAAWVSTTAYTGGQQASYNGHTWTAKWWTENDVPGGPAGVWTDDGPC